MDNTQKSGDSFNQKEQEIKDELRQETQRYADTAKDYVRSASNKVEEATEKAKEKGQELMERFNEKEQKAKEQMQKAAKQADEYAHQNPWSLIAGAALIGFFMGMLVKNDRNRY